MKTTIDLPADLVREMKLRAVREGRKLREVAADVFRLGLATPPKSSPSRKRRRVKLPIIKARPGAKKMVLTGDQVHRLEMETETESYEASLRR